MTNGIPLPHPWSVNIASADAVRHAARVARRLGAQVVIVNFHWGTEYQAQPSAFQLNTARALATDPDITAIVGQHVHVVQPIGDALRRHQAPAGALRASYDRTTSVVGRIPNFLGPLPGRLR